MSTVTRETVLSLSKRHQSVHLTLVISAELSDIDRYEAVGIKMEPSISTEWSKEARKRVFFDGIAEGVMVGRKNANFTTPRNGRDLEVLIERFKLSIPVERLSKGELRELGRQLKPLIAEDTRQLLDNLET